MAKVFSVAEQFNPIQQMFSVASTSHICSPTQVYALSPAAPLLGLHAEAFSPGGMPAGDERRDERRDRRTDEWRDEERSSRRADDRDRRDDQRDDQRDDRR